MSLRSIQLASDVENFFKNEVDSAAKKQGLSLSPFASIYLCKLLSKFSMSEQYHREQKLPNGEKTNSPALALIWLESQNLSSAAQYYNMQYLGDLSLFTSGFFAERIKKSLVDMDYYIAMGEQAYKRAGHLTNSIAAERKIENIFFELSSDFESFVELFAEIADKNFHHSESDLLRLYQKWHEGGSQRIRRILEEKGIIPSKTSGGEDS